MSENTCRLCGTAELTPTSRHCRDCRAVIRRPRSRAAGLTTAPQSGRGTSRALRALTERIDAARAALALDPDNDVASFDLATAQRRALALAQRLDPSGAQYEVVTAAVTGIRADASVWRGGKVSGALGAPVDPAALRDALDAEPHRWGEWHGRVPTGRDPEPQPAALALRAVLALAADERVAMPATRRLALAAIASGECESESGRVIGTRLAEAVGVAPREGVAVLAEATSWALALAGRAWRRETVDTGAGAPALMPSIWGGDAGAVSRVAQARAAVASAAPGAERDAARAALAQARADAQARRDARRDPDDGPVKVAQGAPRAARPAPRLPYVSGARRYALRVFGRAVAPDYSPAQWVDTRRERLASERGAGARERVAAVRPAVAAVLDAGREYRRALARVMAAQADAHAPMTRAQARDIASARLDVLRAADALAQAQARRDAAVSERRDFPTGGEYVATARLTGPGYRRGTTASGGRRVARTVARSAASTRKRGAATAEAPAQRQRPTALLAAL